MYAKYTVICHCYTLGIYIHGLLLHVCMAFQFMSLQTTISHMTSALFSVGFLQYPTQINTSDITYSMFCTSLLQHPTQTVASDMTFVMLFLSLLQHPTQNNANDITYIMFHTAFLSYNPNCHFILFKMHDGRISFLLIFSNN